MITGFNRPNLSFEVEYAPDEAAKYEALRDLLGELTEGAAIIYAGTRRDAEEVAEFIRAVVEKRAEHYHAGLENSLRARVQEQFISDKLNIVVATNAFGMGIDRPDVRLVIHFATPGTLEAYYQEAGRAGRDGQPARAVLLHSPEDRALQEWFIENDAPAPTELRTLYDALAAKRAAQFWIGYNEISLATHLPETKARVGLAQLEAAGSITRLGDENVKMWLRLGAWNEAAAKESAAEVEARRRHRRAQLDAMIAYAESNHCRRRILLDHFGDHSPAEAARCCDNCLVKQSTPQLAASAELAELTQAERIPLIILDALRRLDWGIGRDKLADLLHGSRSRDITKVGYDQKSYYGRLSVFHKSEIEDMIDQLLQSGHLKKLGGIRPVLRLTPKGESSLKAKERIPLKLPRSASPAIIARKKAVKDAGGTVELTGQLFRQGLSPEQIAKQRGLHERTIYGHLAYLIRVNELSLDKVVPESIAVQIWVAIKKIGSGKSLSAIKARLPATISYDQIKCVVAKWDKENANRPRVSEAVTDFLSRSHPRKLLGPWQVGWSLGFHSRHEGATWSRSPVGELAYRLKYQADASALGPLVEQALTLCREHPELAQVDAIAPVPSTETRAFAPVRALAEALAAKLGKPLWTGLSKTRQTAPQKEMHTLAEKRANVAGAFAAPHETRGKRLLVLDDLYDSGATLEEVARTLKQAGAAAVCVLTLTSTIHSDA
jgi:superfamily II DNA helicase RecQ/adenine/guanine phosphoribosyltransferase-like PRPP-binding protein